MLITTLALAADEVCAAWDEPYHFEVADIEETQSSGLARWGDVLFTMNDAGGATELYAIRTDGSFVGTQTVDGATNEDWEDLAVGPCPSAIDAEDCLYIADIGDNDEARASITLWVTEASTDARATAIACPLVYDDGAARDAEALLVAPDGSVRIATKEGDGEAKIYYASKLDCADTPQALTREAEVTVDGPVTGGAVSEDGLQVVLRTAGMAYVWTACEVDWTVEPATVALPDEEQGEAITVGEGGTLYTTSEGAVLRVGVAACAESAASPCDTCGCVTGGSVGWGFLLGMAGLMRRRSARTALPTLDR